jgi:hypothetical protein
VVLTTYPKKNKKREAVNEDSKQDSQKIKIKNKQRGEAVNEDSKQGSQPQLAQWALQL